MTRTGMAWTGAVGLALLTGATAARAAAPAPPGDVRADLLTADRAFSARAASAGAPIAWRDTMDPVDGLDFDGTPGEPAKGTAAIYASAQKEFGPGKISWAPSDGFAASSGDMGVTWGHWRFAPPGGVTKPVTGKYVTVWRKDARGAWKGLIDIGNPD